MNLAKESWKFGQPRFIDDGEDALYVEFPDRTVKYVPERTCHVVGSYYNELMDESYTDLSCGHHLRGAERDFDFCYRCGARIVLCYNS